MEAGGGWGKLLDDRPPTGLLLEAQKYVASRLEKKWLPMFLATEEFCERQNPRSSLGDVAEDLLLMKRRKSTQVWKVRNQCGDFYLFGNISSYCCIVYRNDIDARITLTLGNTICIDIYRY